MRCFFSAHQRGGKVRHGEDHRKACPSRVRPYFDFGVMTPRYIATYYQAQPGSTLFSRVERGEEVLHDMLRDTASGVLDAELAPALFHGVHTVLDEIKQ